MGQEIEISSFAEFVAPMVGGMVSVTVLTLVVIPAIFALVAEAGLARAHQSNADSPAAVG